MQYTCGIFLITKDCKVLLSHPTNGVDNIWHIPKGLTELNETFENAAIREFKEETNIDLDIENLIYINEVKYKNKDKKLIAFKYYTELNSFDFNPICYSMVNLPNGVSFPENDKFIFVDINDVNKYLHYTQQNLI